MFHFDGEVRYSEVDSKKQMKLSNLLDYLQDCCTMESEELGVGVDYLKEHAQAWVLSSWEIKVIRYPQLGEKISVATWPYSFKGFYGYRNFTIQDKKGNTIVVANSVWVYMDLTKMRPMRVTDEMAAAYQNSFAPELEGEWASRKIEKGEPGELQEMFEVKRFQIDTNHHMNNSKYVLASQEYLPEDFSTHALRVEYKKAAMLQDKIKPYVTVEADKALVILADESDKPYAVLEFRR